MLRINVKQYSWRRYDHQDLYIQLMQSNVTATEIANTMNSTITRHSSKCFT